MTPAATSAGRRAKAKGASETAANARRRSDGTAPSDRHRRELARGTGPPRRVSGPRQGVAGGATGAPAQRRDPGPVPRRAARPTARGADRAATLPTRAFAFIRALPDHALIDRLLRGRAWIPLLGVMLAGIVAMQVELLKLSANIGHSIDRGASLQSQNEQLRASVASLADDQRIERVAARNGMIMPAPEHVVFLAPRSGVDAQRAVARMRPPDASATGALQAAATAGTSSVAGAATTGLAASLTSAPSVASTAGSPASPAGASTASVPATSSSTSTTTSASSAASSQTPASAAAASSTGGSAPGAVSDSGTTAAPAGPGGAQTQSTPSGTGG